MSDGLCDLVTVFTWSQYSLPCYVKKKNVHDLKKICRFGPLMLKLTDFYFMLPFCIYLLLRILAFKILLLLF